MDNNTISVKQRCALVVCALLSPLVRVVPVEAGALAGEGAWISPLLALAVFLPALWVLLSAFRRLPPGAGLETLYRLAFGKKLGRLLTAATGIWLVVVSAGALRFYAESEVSSVYPGTSLWLFLLGLLAVVWYVCRQGFAAVCRMAQIALYVLGATLGLILLLGIREAHLYHIWPFWIQGTSKLLSSAVPVLVILSYSLPILFCRWEGEAQGGLKVTALWMAGLCLTLSLMAAVILGMFGWQTVVRMEMPLFSMAKEVSLLDVIERVESVVAAVWVLSDGALIAAMMSACTRYLQKGVHPFNQSILLTLSVAASAVLAAVLVPNAFQLRKLWEETLQYIDAAVFLILPLSACLVAKLRRTL